MSERGRKLAWAAVIVASATAISRIVGLGREVLTASVYGVTADYNTFVSVSVVPNLIRQLFADAAISAAFVPVLTALLAAGTRAPAEVGRCTGCAGTSSSTCTTQTRCPRTWNRSWRWSTRTGTAPSSGSEPRALLAELRLTFGPQDRSGQKEDRR